MDSDRRIDPLNNSSNRSTSRTTGRTDSRVNSRVFISLGLLAVLLLAGIVAPGAAVPAVRAAPAVTVDEEIVYIDGGGIIRVIDPNVPSSGGSQQYQEIKWYSPEGGWYDFATGDFNNDGDYEIAAIGNNKLTIFDPVVQSADITPDGEINGVRWVRLYERSAPGANIIAAGNLDRNVSGDEIIYGLPVSEPNNISYRLIVLKQTQANGNGKNWIGHISQGYAANWQFVTAGNLNNAGSDDIVLIRDVDRRISLNEVDNNLHELYSRSNEAFTYRSAAIGQVYAGGTGEVAMVRTFSGTDQSPSVLIYRFENNQWTVGNDIGHNYPHPFFVFMADVNGNGDDEVFWIREYPGETTTRLFMINRGSDQLPGFQSGLDSDNGYRVGAGGDVDGDGRDEVIVMRNNRIRNYYSPESGNTALFIDYGNITTNSRSLKVANLDGQGYISNPRFSASVDKLELTLQAGTSDASVIRIELNNVGSGGNLSFTATKEKGANWFTLSTSGNTTPASIFVSAVSATDLTPGVYTDRIVVTSSNQSVVNQPFYITVVLTVTNAAFSLSVDNLAFIFLAGGSGSQSQGIRVDGLPGLKFSAAILSKPTVAAAQAALGGKARFGYITDDGRLVLTNGLGDSYAIALEAGNGDRPAAAAVNWPSGVPWATASSVTTATPDTITVTATSAQLGGTYDEAVLVVLADERAGEYPSNAAFTSLYALKAQVQTFMPFVSRK